MFLRNWEMKMINVREILVKIPPKYSVCCKVSFGTRLVILLQKETENLL